MKANIFSDEEIAEVRSKYPTLRLESPGILEGNITVHAEYDGKRITDSFEIRIAALNPHSIRLPALYEIGERTAAIAAKHRVKDLRDLHRNFDGATCVCVKQDEKRRFPPGSTLLKFIEDLAIPYLYGLSRFEAEGKWPWEGYSHGAIGLLEFYSDNEQEQSKEDIVEILGMIRADDNWRLYGKQLRSPSAKRECLCGSGKSLGRCHRRAWNGIERLNAEIGRLHLRPLLDNWAAVHQK